MSLDRRLPFTPLVLSAALVAAVPPALAQTSFVTFETGQVRPLALSPDGETLFATNTPDNRLEIFAITAQGLHHLHSVVVGLEPLAVAVRSNTQVWVVNHLSDSVSIVDYAATPPRVVRTLLVGDEPRDIVFAGDNKSRAFITTARRGQHFTHPSLADVVGAGEPKLTTRSEPRASVWVFDANLLTSALGGRPLRIVNLFSDVPRGLAVSPDGATVYAAAFPSGNKTTVVTEGTVCPGFDPSTPCVLEGGVEYPGGNAGPATNFEGHPAPTVGVMVKLNPATGHFEDTMGRNWDNAIRFNLPDLDVFGIDAASLDQVWGFSGVGTTLFNMVTNPQSGALYVSNTESVNQVRFEGPGVFGGSTVQGHLAESRITVIADGEVLPRHLNKHIDYDVRPAPPSTKTHSLATPTHMEISADGATLYVAAFGSSRVGVFATEALENDTFDPTVASANYLSVSGGGPSGLALDEERNRLYVLTRFDNGISVVDLAERTEVDHLAMHNPEPEHVVAGRRFLYDAVETSSNGEASCSSCHVYADKDELAWDLGNPDAAVSKNPGGVPNIRLALGALLREPDINGTGRLLDFHPMKGPMTTQTLRGLRNSGAMHWRGDRATGFFGDDENSRPPFDADLAFRNFIVAFEGLNGRAGLISAADMQSFADFALEITLPPNPVRALDNSLNSNQSRGERFFMGCEGKDSITTLPALCIGGRPLGEGHRVDGVPFLPELGFTCQGCHQTSAKRDFFGTDGRWAFDQLPQILKIPHLRNMYTKVGKYGFPEVDTVNSGDNEHTGDQIRGFGFLHDGGVDSMFRFFQGKVFNCTEGELVGFCGGDRQRRDVVEFMLAFDSDLPPIVGQQMTLSASNRGDAATNARINLLEGQCRTRFTSKLLGRWARECDLVARAIDGDRPVGFLLERRNRFRRDDGSEISSQALRDLALTPGREVTFTAVPYGSGERIAWDRDVDGSRDPQDPCPADPSCR